MLRLTTERRRRALPCVTVDVLAVFGVQVGRIEAARNFVRLMHSLPDVAVRAQDTLDLADERNVRCCWECFEPLQRLGYLWRKDRHPNPFNNGKLDCRMLLVDHLEPPDSEQ